VPVLRDPDRVRALLPRRRRPAARALLGRHPERGQGVPGAGAVGLALSGWRDRAGRAGVQHHRRRAAGRPRSESGGAVTCASEVGLISSQRGFTENTTRRFCDRQASVGSGQSWISFPKLTVEVRSAATPRETRYSRAAPARRSPRARLYSAVPRSSQYPSIRTSMWGFALSHSALASRIVASSGRIADLSKSK